MASKAAGGCLLVLLGGGAATVLVIAAPTVGILTLWTVGFGVLWWSVSHARNPSPPPPEPLPETEEPQVRIVQDPNNPARHIVKRVTEKESS